MKTLFFEQFELGQTFKSPAPRPVTDDMIRRFAELSGDKNPLHLDDAFAARTPFGERIAHGLLGLSVASGLLHDAGIVSETIVAFARLDWRFTGPIRIGDTLSLKMTVLKTKAASSQAGLVIFDAAVTNQKGEAVQKGDWSLMVKRKPA